MIEPCRARALCRQPAERSSGQPLQANSRCGGDEARWVRAAAINRHCTTGAGPPDPVNARQKEDRMWARTDGQQMGREGKCGLWCGADRVPEHLCEPAPPSERAATPASHCACAAHRSARACPHSQAFLHRSVRYPFSSRPLAAHRSTAPGITVLRVQRVPAPAPPRAELSRHRWYVGCQQGDEPRTFRDPSA